MTRTATADPFAGETVAVARDSFVTDIDGAEFVVHIGARVRASHAIVRKHPTWFVRDGESSRSPSSTTRRGSSGRARRRFKAKRDYQNRAGLAEGSVLVTVRKGDVCDERHPCYLAMSPALRREVFEEIK